MLPAVPACLQEEQLPHWPGRRVQVQASRAGSGSAVCALSSMTVSGRRLGGVPAVRVTTAAALALDNACYGSCACLRHLSSDWPQVVVQVVVQVVAPPSFTPSPPLAPQEHFSVIVSSGDVEHSKPAPDIYRLAADKLGVPPDRWAECMVHARGAAAGGRSVGMHTVVCALRGCVAQELPLQRR